MTFGVGRPEKVTTPGDGDRDARLAAMAATNNNPWAFGLTPNNEANQVKATRDPQYGNLRTLPNEINNDNFAQKGSFTNASMEDVDNQTGSLSQRTSLTDDPHTDHENLGISQIMKEANNGIDTSDLDKRVAMLSGKMGSTNKNSIPSIYPRHTQT
tara:strand:- start:237 stop:704 length:468 start_codon:yes stop_codon:yes gene_type:complete